MGVAFFPCLPFMGVTLFPSCVLGNASGEGGTFLVPLSLFSILLCLREEKPKEKGKKEFFFKT